MAIGQKLEEARNRKGISLREASESTKIRGDYLTAFESSSFDIIKFTSKLLYNLIV